MILILARDALIASQVQDGLRQVGRDAEVIADIDATNMRAVRSAVEERRPKAVLHMSFLDDAAACEANPDRAFLHNAESVINLAAATLEFEAIPVIWSPAHVLAGAGHRGEDDAPQAISTWTESRIRGEVFLRRAAPRGLVLRSGPLLSKGLVSEATRLESGVMVGSALVQPVLASWLGHVLHAALVAQLHGVLHVRGAGPTRPEHEVWAEIAGRVGRVSSAVQVDPVAGAGNAVLHCERWSALGDVGEPPNWTQVLDWPAPAYKPKPSEASLSSVEPGAPPPSASTTGSTLSGLGAAESSSRAVASDPASPAAGGLTTAAAVDSTSPDAPQKVSDAPDVWVWRLVAGDARRWAPPCSVRLQVVAGKAFIEMGDEDVALKGLKQLEVAPGVPLRATVPETTVVVVVALTDVAQ